MRESKLPLPVINAMEALPAGAHPMSLLMTGVMALGTLHPEQNPALAGQSVYNSTEVQDAQIVRLLGKVPGIAAYAYHRRAMLPYWLEEHDKAPSLCGMTCCTVDCVLRQCMLELVPHAKVLSP